MPTAYGTLGSGISDCPTEHCRRFASINALMLESWTDRAILYDNRLYLIDRQY